MNAEASTFDFPPQAFAILKAIEDAGYEAWFVGGCVRDTLMGHAIHDIDIATSALWHEVANACSVQGMQAHETGTAHGTVTIVCDGMACEVTTFRTDSTTSSDHRHPDRVDFINSIEEDLLRRDFTINAMAWHPQRGLKDPYGGSTDIRRSMIRTVGSPKERFREDALRILRACRFASELGFKIDAATYQAMLSAKSLLATVSTERITSELDRFLLGAHVHDALMDTVDVLAYIIPELVAMKGCVQATRYHIYDVLEHTAWAVQLAKPTRRVRWAAFCHDMGKPAAAFFDPDGVEHFYGHAAVSAILANGLMDRLLMSSRFKADVCAMISAHSNTYSGDRRTVKRALAHLDGNVDVLRALFDLKRADILAHAPEYRRQTEQIDQAERMLDAILEEEDACTVSQLAIDGNDVMGLGIEPGPAIGHALQKALDAVIDDDLPNDKDTLLDFLASSLRLDK